MATLKLDVPLDAQTKSDTCWHASAQMIWWYWQGKTGRQGPMWTLPNNYELNKGVTPLQFSKLAANVGLSAVPRSKEYTSDTLVKLLTDHGPLWCAGYWFGVGHIIVLTGAEDGKIYLNDPDGGVRKENTVAWFNTKLANQFDGCLMCKNPDAY